LTLFFYSELM